MLAIRMTRHGAKKRPFFHIVVADSRSPRDGRFIEKLGTYNPLLPREHAQRITLDKERIAHWLKVGAQPSDRVAKFLSQAEMMKPRERREQTKKPQPRAKAQERMKYLTDSVVAARRTVEITHDQYRQGAIDFTPVFIFEAALTSQQDDLAQAQADIALSLVDLYRSLGGGWEADPEGGTYEAPAVPAPTTQRSATSRPSILGATTRPMK
jgi:small subunit ribosomal protein S16